MRLHRLTGLISQCFVLSKQSDSPCPYQFKIGCLTMAACEKASARRPLTQKGNRHCCRPPPHTHPQKRSARREIPVPNQPLEPILIASLRIYFADFPYLHSSIKLEALHLGDLLRLSVRPPTTNGTNNAPITPSDFQGPPNARRTPQTKKVAWCSAELPAQSPAKLIPGPESSSMPHKNCVNTKPPIMHSIKAMHNQKKKYSLRRKENSSQGIRQRLRVCLRCR